LSTPEHTSRYTKFTFEEFLQDDFFVSSMKQPTIETISFWNRFMRENEGHTIEFDAACRFLDDVCNMSLPDKEVRKIWLNVTNSRRKVIRRRIILFSEIAAAACVAAVLFLKLFSTEKAEETFKPIDIIAFANENNLYNPSEATQLILSDDKIISINDKETSIKYDADNITVSSDNISKEGSQPFNQLIVPYGKRSILALADGTVIHINAGTRVIYPVDFGTERREVFIEGEAYFDVKADKKRPFFVKTCDDAIIKVTGTKFNVQAYSDDDRIRVALETGIVSVKSSNQHNEVTLMPNQLYETCNGDYSVKDVNIMEYTAWIEGLYLYKSEKMESIIRRLSRYYGKNIEVSPDAQNVKCSGKLDMKERLEDVLDGITFTAPVEWNKSGDTYHIMFKYN
jgi:ferric-dicitrate binding protein FerR (iron transport regulator)